VDEAPASPAQATHLYGGQAVIEGVMMRGQDHWAVAVREPNGTVYVESHDIDSIAARHALWRRPFFRGMVVLGQSLKIGVRALLVASNHATEEEEQLSSRQVGVSLTIAMVAFVAVFVLGPTSLFVWLENKLDIRGVIVNIAEGVFRVALFVGYLWLIGRTKDIHRVFEYHGAEHKVVFNFESGKAVNVENAQSFTTLHPRCGTSFLLVVMAISTLIYMLLPFDSFVAKFAARIVLLPVIAGLSYELIRFAAKRRSSLMAALTTPGLWLQKITTQPPSDEQTAIAIHALEGAMKLEKQQGGELVIA